MRVRLALVLALLTGAFVASIPAVHAAPRHVLAQADTDSQSEDSSSSSDTQKDEGQGGADAETGADKKAQEPAEEEEGPPWTYQMAKITLAMLALVFLGMGLAYWRLIGSRQRGAV
jgi:hypothetical protein